MLPGESSARPKNTSVSVLLMLAGVGLFAAGVLWPVLRHGEPRALGAVMVRMFALGLLAALCWRRRSLMAWIFWAMIAGGELGAGRTGLAVSLRVFSDIFLRLIKTIVAPLILGTLITGIAAHGQMRSLGRMGLKALVYFEVLTTVAMLVGLAAINISSAGVGLGWSRSSRLHGAMFAGGRAACAGMQFCCIPFPRTLPSLWPTTRFCRWPSSPSCLEWPWAG